MYTKESVPPGAVDPDAGKSRGRRPVSWEIISRLNPVHGRAVSAVTASVAGVLLLAVLCLRLTNWNSTQATRLFVAMPLSTVLRTMALAVIPAVFVALFLIVPWLFGSWITARYADRNRRVNAGTYARGDLRKYQVGIPITALFAAAILLTLLAVVEGWPAVRVVGYGTALLVAFLSGVGIEAAINSAPAGWTFSQLFAEMVHTWPRICSSIFGLLIFLGGVLFTFKPILANPPGWLAWECMKISIPPEQQGLYRYPDLQENKATADHEVYVVGEHHGQLVILDEETRYVYLLDKDWIKADRFCKTSL